MRSLFLAAGAALVLAGCSALPGSGPLADDVVAGESALEGRYVVVTVDDRVVSILDRPGPSLRARFGDHRPPAAYRIGVGDSLRVTLWEAAAGGLFSSPAIDRFGTGSRSAVVPDQVVGQDRTVTIPYAGRLDVVGRTPAEVERLILDALAGKAIQPQAIVTVTNQVANMATVTGEALGTPAATATAGSASATPLSAAATGSAALAALTGLSAANASLTGASATTGASSSSAATSSGNRVPLSPAGDRVMDVIASAGGVAGSVHETFVRLMRGGVTVTVPLEEILARPSENIFVRPGDVLVLVREPQGFTAFGATGRTAVVPFGKVRVSLEEAVAKAGGLVDIQADPDGVFLLRFEPPATVRRLVPDRRIDPREGLIPVIYRLPLRDARSYFLARSFAVRDKDILYVSNATGVELQKFLTLVTSVVTPASSATTGIAPLVTSASASTISANVVTGVTPAATPAAAAVPAAAVPVR